MRGRGRPVAQVVAPMAGTVVRMADVPDPVFADDVVGLGVAILPLEAVPERDGTDRGVVVAPCDGRVVSAYPHAVVVQVDDDRAVLVHLGLGTGTLGGEGFDLVVRDGAWVTAGQPVLAWSPARVRATDRSSLSPVVALQARSSDVVLLVDEGAQVAEAQPVLLWS
jgi:glucose-specific phosphotransferase system IIA component